MRILAAEAKAPPTDLARFALLDAIRASAAETLPGSAAARCHDFVDDEGHLPS